MREACGGQAVRLGAKPLAHASNPCPKGGRVGRSTVSPQHADLVGMSQAKRPQGHAQKIKT
ncbi:MAG: hypothetical protein RML94_06440 [Bacteroidia bacterium]|nr:hypothetical protein [Bacteroidia bacterium]